MSSQDQDNLIHVWMDGDLSTSTGTDPCQNDWAASSGVEIINKINRFMTQKKTDEQTGHSQLQKHIPGNLVAASWK